MLSGCQLHSHVVTVFGKKTASAAFLFHKQEVTLANISATRRRNLQVRNNYTKKWSTKWLKWYKSFRKFIQPSSTMKTEEVDSAKRWYLSKNNARYHFKEDQEFNSKRREKGELTVFASDTTQITNFRSDGHTAIRVVNVMRLTRIKAKRCTAH